MDHSESVSAGTGVDRDVVDVVLVGGGIMSATLGALLARLQPDWSIVMLERLDELAGESSGPWSNAGTGHAGLCELNYMPDPGDSAKAEDIGRQFHLSRQFWASLVEGGDLPAPASFISPTPHMDVVFGDRDVDYLRRRFATLRRSPLFSAMEYTEDPETIRRWAPLLMDGRAGTESMAATRYAGGTDVDFGALTHALTAAMTARGAQVRLRHEVTGLSRGADGLWTVTGRDRGCGDRFGIRSRFVFVGAGGYALKLLQKARVPEVRGYAVFPLGAQFLRTGNPDVVARHDAKVYSQASVGAPPMSVPHLDRRVVEGNPALMFGPYATFSTRLLRRGRLVDLFTTVRLHNIAPLLAVGVQNLPLVRYLIGELLASRKRKFAQLRRFYPGADPADWELVQAGQRAQLIKPHPRKIGVLTFGTELVTGADGTIAGLLGASPGASIAPSVMLDLLAGCFPARHQGWAPTLLALMPGVGGGADTDPDAVDLDVDRTGRVLGVA
ncbi:malate dehydrogenase (quinone) [Rhodococcus tukisamuensis]|uniref:Probable malate:quinone oxidoreductase n=1 Tax=Rhodococcus tukisamuensis TaxID=168276 RepID=A0A1G6SWN1_9NOCA|nr:malate dehydrogenase (quinone) [Rhodococcus tukisamuensis]SDD21189.1 malate dehydrogenase (quinone) [Rhodococcus tukisamuensis]